MNNPLVSVVIPTYNRAGLICQAIDNLFQQTYSNFELIVVDDGSTDDTQSKLRQYGNRIRVITQSNAGPAIARNRGAAAARGEIIAFQDSDDLWKPAKLERQVAALEKAGSSVPCCLSNAVMRIVDGREISSFDISLIHFSHDEGLWLNVLEVLATRFVLFNQTAAIRREVFEKLGGFDEGLKYLEDYDLPMRLAFEGPWTFIREPLVIYREDSPESFSRVGHKDEIGLKDCELAIFQRTLSRVSKADRSQALQELLRWRMKVFSRGMTIIKLKNSRLWVDRLKAKYLDAILHYEHVAFRRSPWFPKAITAPLTDCPSRSRMETFAPALK